MSKKRSADSRKRSSRKMVNRETYQTGRPEYDLASHGSVNKEIFDATSTAQKSRTDEYAAHCISMVDENDFDLIKGGGISLPKVVEYVKENRPAQLVTITLHDSELITFVGKCAAHFNISKNEAFRALLLAGLEPDAYYAREDFETCKEARDKVTRFLQSKTISNLEAAEESALDWLSGNEILQTIKSFSEDRLKMYETKCDLRMQYLRFIASIKHELPQDFASIAHGITPLPKSEMRKGRTPATRQHGKYDMFWEKHLNVILDAFNSDEQCSSIPVNKGLLQTLGSRARYSFSLRFEDGELQNTNSIRSSAVANSLHKLLTDEDKGPIIPSGSYAIKLDGKFNLKIVDGS